MAQRTVKTSTIIIAIVIGTIVIAGTSVGIWLGVRNKDPNLIDTNHPDQDWEFMITGKIKGGDFNISIKEFLNMPQHSEIYEILSDPPYSANFSGVQIQYLFNNIIDIDSSATSVTFYAQDGYFWGFDISSIGTNSSNILAISKNGQYLEGYHEGGIGYLRLIIPSSGPDDFNSQYCLKNVIELRFS